MSQRTERRPVLAALLSFLQPGLGHLYLREWLRAVAWGGLWFGTLAMVVDAAGASLGTAEALAAVVGLGTTVDGVPSEAAVGLFAVTAFATFDAFWVAARNNRRLATRTRHCPHCDGELDPSLEFCHWCTARLDDEESPEPRP